MGAFPSPPDVESCRQSLVSLASFASSVPHFQPLGRSLLIIHATLNHGHSAWTWGGQVEMVLSDWLVLDGHA